MKPAPTRRASKLLRARYFVNDLDICNARRSTDPFSSSIQNAPTITWTINVVPFVQKRERN